MAERLRLFWGQPLSRKLQRLRFLWGRVVTGSWHRSRLRACGSGSIVLRPLFWTPEFVSIGENVLIWPGCRIEGVESREYRATTRPLIVFGDCVTLQQNCHITARGHLTIGSGTTVLFDVMITDVEHHYQQVGVRVVDQPTDVMPTQIGRNCFIGSGAKILAGTILGDNCVVGANAVVRGAFPPGAVVAGVPARIVKQYDSETETWKNVRESPQGY